MTDSTQKFPWTKETRREIVEFLEKVEQSGKWPQQACTTKFFLTPENITSERPIALIANVDSVVESSVSTRGGELAAEVSRREWDATDGRNGGAQRTVWEVLMKWRDLMEEQKQRIKGLCPSFWTWRKLSSGSASLVAWAWATHFSFPRKILRVLCGYFEHQRRVQFKGCAAERLTIITAILPGTKWSCLLLRIVLLKLRFLWLTSRPW